MRADTRRRGYGSAVILAGLLCGVVALAPRPAAAAPGDVTRFTSTEIHLPLGPTVGPDGNVWFASYLNNRIGRITPSGTITTFSDPADNISTPTDTQLNPADSRIWFTSQNNDRIGNIVATSQFGGTVGTVTTFTAAALDEPNNLALGADSNVWVTHANGIARVAPWGAITNFTDVAIAGGTTDLALGPDGNLWFTATSDGRIGKVTPTGVITTYLLPATMAQPTGIGAGPDGNLWVIGAQQHRLATVTTAGVITVLPTEGFAGVQPRGSILRGPDDNLWFFTQDNRIGRITTAGVVATFPTGSSTPLVGGGLVNGPDGNVWFTGGANTVARIEPGAVTPPTTRTLTVAIFGTGQGTITGPGIACPGDCTQAYPNGTAVTLTRHAGGGSNFIGWSGACPVGPSCGVTMTTDRSITTEFRAKPPPTTTFTFSIAGANWVTYTAFFEGGGGVPPLTFQCRMDAGQWKVCTSPRRYPVAHGSHHFRVRAVDARGIFDATPAVDSFRAH